MKQPKTSLEAYKALTPEMLSKDYKDILGSLKRLGKAIMEEIAADLNYSDKNKVSRRMKELEGMQLVHKTGATRPTKSNRQAYEYTLMQPTTAQSNPIQKELFT